MRRLFVIAILCAHALDHAQAHAQTPKEARVIALDPAGLRPLGVAVASETYRGRAALKVTESVDAATTAPRGALERMALLPETTLTDGEIEVDLASEVAPGAAEGARGFIGLAFRVQGEGERFEYFYLRPANGRADDQVRRNHSLQYSAHPGYSWDVLRAKEPERYESYADMTPARWMRLRIEVRARKARFYLDGAEQPNLIVNDLKLGVSGGAIGLWIGPGTVGYFANLRVTPAR